MKKIIALTMALAMASLLGACGAPAAPAPAPEAPAAPAEQPAAPAAPDAPADEPAQPAEGGKVEKIKAAGKIILGTSADFPPYEFHDVSEGKDVISGFDVSLAHEIAKDLGVELVIQDQDFDGLIAALNANAVDMVLSGMNASEDRKVAVDFSDEYYFAEQTVLVMAKDKDSYNTIEDFSGKTVGAQLGSLQEGFANDQLAPAGAKVFSIANVQGLVLELMSGNVAGVVLDKPIAEAFVRQNDQVAICATPIEGDVSGFAVAINKGNEDLVASINATLKRLGDENKIDQLFADAVTLADKQ